MEENKSKFKLRFVYSFLPAIVLLLLYIVYEFSHLYSSQYNITKNNLLQQVRLCGITINTKLYEFEDQSIFFTNSYPDLNLESDFLVKNESYKKALRKFFFSNQELIDSITIRNKSHKRVFHKESNNYFVWTDQEKTTTTQFLSKTTYQAFGDSILLIIPVYNAAGFVTHNYTFHLNIKKFIRSEFANYYVGEESWKTLLNNNGKIIFTNYSESVHFPEIPEVSNIDSIRQRLSDGYEGIIQHYLYNKPGTTKLLSAYYPITILDNRFGILFSYNAEVYIDKPWNSSVRIAAGLLIIILLVIGIFYFLSKNRSKIINELLLSEERQRLILNSFPDTTVFQDSEGIYREFFRGDSENEILKHLFFGKNHFQVFPETIAKEIDTKIKIAHANNEVTLYDHYDNMLKQNYEYRFSPLSQNNTLTIIRNVTEAKVIEEKLKFSHELFVTVLNSIDAFIYVADFRSYEILFINQAGREQFGDVIGKTCYKVLQKGKSSPCEFCTNERLIDENGEARAPVVWEFQNSITHRWYRLYDRAIPWVDGRLVRFEMAVDITDIKEAEIKIKASEEKFRSIFESFIDLYYRSDMNGIVKMVSPSIESLTGWKAEEFIGKNVSILYKHPPVRRQFLKKLYRELKVNDYEITLLKKDGTAIPVSANSRVILDDENNAIGIEGSLRDMTERKQNELELLKAKEAAQVADKAKSRFLASMSHELRTPLNGILGYAQVLLSEPELEGKIRDGVNIIQRSGEHLLSLINDILDLSKIEANKIEIELSSVILEEFIRSIVELVELKAKDKNLLFIVKKGEDIPPQFYLDERKLKQILINLITNAIKFTDSGSVTLKYYYEEGKLTFEVTDTGIGIPEEKHDDVFSPFKQLSNRVNKSDGTGLGLSISKNLVMLMGGELLLESEVNVGTKFWFSLPVEIDNEHLQLFTEEKTIIGFTEDSKKIVIADDLATNRRVIKRMLEPLGFRIFETENGEEAIKLAITEKADLVLMDQKMPGVSGVDAISEIKKELNVPCIIVSASPQDDEFAFTSQQGVDDFILKPVRKSDLLDLIQKHLNLNWKQETVQQEAASVPDETDLLMLKGFISKRNFSKFHSYLKELESNSPQHKQFLTELKNLANQFDVIKIKEYIDSNLEEKQ